MKDDVIEAHSKSTSIGWRIDETNKIKKSNSIDNYSSSISMGLHSVPSNEKNLTIPHTEVNTTYNHTDQTYQYSGQTSTVVQTSPFLLSHSQSKPESSMYSSHGTVHHPYTRSEASISNSSTSTTNSGLQTQTNTASISSCHPYSIHTQASNINPIGQQTSILPSMAPFSNIPFEPLKSAQSPNLMAQQETSPAVSQPHTPQIESLGLYSHSQHYSPYGNT